MTDKRVIRLPSGKVIADPSEDKVTVLVKEGKRIDDFLDTRRIPKRFQ